MWQATESIQIEAPIETVWEIVSDVARHHELAGSGEVKAIRIDGPVNVGTGWEADEKVKFAGEFVARSECVEFDPPKVFSWKSFPPPMKSGNPKTAPDVTWWFRLEPSGSGTRLSHSFRVVEPRSMGWAFKLFYMVTRRASAIQKGMRKTLKNVNAAATALENS